MRLQVLLLLAVTASCGAVNGGEDCATSQLVLVNNRSSSVLICVDDPSCNPYQDGNTIQAGDTSVRTVEPGDHHMWSSSSSLGCSNWENGQRDVEVGCSSKTVTCE